jgi:uncharacterized membrane protein YvbJ
MASTNRFCDQCGTDIPRENSQFCTSCGVAIPSHSSEGQQPTREDSGPREIAFTGDAGVQKWTLTRLVRLILITLALPIISWFVYSFLYKI